MKKLYVGNLSFKATETDVRALFEPFGQVDEVHIVTDRATGRARGFAFVEMGDDDAAGKAIAAMNGKVVDGRALNVNEARPKPQGGGGFGGGGGGGRRPGGGGGGGRGGSRDDYRGAARQPREPRW